jgi:putative transposase
MVNYTRDVKEGCSKATLRLYYFPEHFEQVSLASQLLSHLAGVLFLTRTLIFRSHIPKRIADDLNQESARHYTNVMKWHWRIYRKHGIWLSPSAAEKLEDYLGQGSTLHAHSRDAAQQAFYKACKTTRTRRKQGDPEAKFPHKRKRYRTTYWKNTGIYKVENGVMFLSRAQGLERVRLRLPRHLTHLQKEDILEVRLVFNRKNKRYDWHFVVNDLEPSPPPGDNVMAVDMGEIHPAVASDPEQAVLFSTRELRALYQYRNKRLAQFQEAQSRCLNYSRRWWRLQRRKRKFLALVERKSRDILHKVSRAVVNFGIERKVGRIAIGDVRDIGDGKRLKVESQQKISQWPHGKLRQYITYKAAWTGITVELVDERDTSQTCPWCLNRKKQRRRTYRCSRCRAQAHRDVVGAVNILSRYLYGELGRIKPPAKFKVSHPFKVRSSPGHGAHSL